MIRRALPTVLVLLAAASGTCHPFEARSLAAGDVTSVADAASWGHQLQGYDLARLAASHGDLLVVDYSRGGAAAGEWTPAEVARMQAGPCGRRLVVAYRSVGEAERFRS